MGQTLSEPVTTKETTSYQNDQVKVGASCMQGWRVNMEDQHTILLSVPEDKSAMFFGVYDGHGGARVAQYAGSHVHKRIVNHPLYKRGSISEAIKQGFLLIDEDMLNDDSMKDELAGTTAVIVIVRSNKIYCGNVGDSRAIACVRGRVQQLSFDHKPGNESEARRIVAAGGWVEFNRVNGNLALSRALGDFVFKRNDKKKAEEQIVTAYPDVIVKDLTPDHEFILLACDGIWDVMTNEEVVEFIRSRISERMEPEEICEELMMRCLAPDCQMGGLGCDNMTVVLVCLLKGGTYDELAAKCLKTPAGSSKIRGIPRMNRIQDDRSSNATDDTSTDESAAYFGSGRQRNIIGGNDYNGEYDDDEVELDAEAEGQGPVVVGDQNEGEGVVVGAVAVAGTSVGGKKTFQRMETPRMYKDYAAEAFRNFYGPVAIEDSRQFEQGDLDGSQDQPEAYAERPINTTALMDNSDLLSEQSSTGAVIDGDIGSTTDVRIMNHRNKSLDRLPSEAKMSVEKSDQGSSPRIEDVGKELLEKTISQGLKELDADKKGSRERGDLSANTLAEPVIDMLGTTESIIETSSPRTNAEEAEPNRRRASSEKVVTETNSHQRPSTVAPTSGTGGNQANQDGASTDDRKTTSVSRSKSEALDHS